MEIPNPNLCEDCNQPINFCEACGGSGYQEDDGSVQSWLDPYPCTHCSGWNGDPDNDEHWSEFTRNWIPGLGNFGCETKDCPGNLRTYE